MPPDSADEQLKAAWQCFAGTDLPGAARHARAALAARPDFAAASAALGFFLLQSGELEQAAAVLLPALDGAPDYAPLHWYTGYLYQRQGHLPRAANSLRRACELDGNLDEAAFALGWVLHDLGELEEAQHWAERALAAAVLPHRLLQVGWLQQQRKRYRVAVRTYRRALAITPPDVAEYAQLCLHLSQCLAQLGNTREASAALEHGLELHPEHADLLTESAWQLRRRGEVGGARVIARGLVQTHPQRASAWYLLGLLEEDSAELRAADEAYASALEREPAHAEALLRRARLQRRWGHYTGARWLLDTLLFHQPDHEAAGDLLIQVLLDLGEDRDARRRLAVRLRGGGADADLWRLLAASQARRGRQRAARRTLQRVLRMDPGNIEALRTTGWLAMEQGDMAAAVDAVRRLLARVPGEGVAQAQAGFVFAAASQLAEAELWAQRAVAGSPKEAEAWRALSQVRYLQHRLDDAEHAIQQALSLAPGRADSLRHLGWICMASQRSGQAQLAFRRALEASPGDPVARLELAQALRQSGDFAAAMAAADDLLNQRPDWAAALALKALLLTEGPFAAEGHRTAVQVVQQLLRRGERVGESQRLLMSLVAQGSKDASRALQAVPPGPRLAAYLETVAETVHTRGPAWLARLVHEARRDFPEDLWLHTADLYAQSVSEYSTCESLALAARDWYRALKIRSGLSPLDLGGRALGVARRPRLAYITSQVHHSLLRRVLAAHDPVQVDVFVYTHQPGLDVPAHVRVCPLAPQTLAESCAANAVDVVIDAGGLHPFEGQFGLLQAYARRLAPLQVGWLGCWGSSGGLFDALLSDRWAVPEHHEQHYEESVLKVEGGQWCWDPPVAAPEPAPPPVLRNGTITFGVVARGLRLNAASQQAIAQVAAAMPDSAVRFIGPVAADWPLRREILARLGENGVAQHRVSFDPARAPAGFLDWCAQVDIVLDTFPGNGGLSLLDPLWMGVPVVTRAGEWAGARQGCSLLNTLGLAEWVADDAAAYRRIALALANDPANLARQRVSLRERMRASPLLDGRHVAQRIEQIAGDTLAALLAGGAPDNRKAQVRQQADRALAAWLAVPHVIRLPAVPEGEVPALSVVVVLFNQAGLSRKMLQALADQRGATFETIIVDNASSDATGELLARVHGATIVRNADNRGFLLAANQGAALARGRYLVLLNSDAFLQEGALQAALQALDADPSIGVLGGRIVLTDGGLQEAGNVIFRDGSGGGIGRGEDPFGPAARAARSTDYVSGVLLATPRVLWEQLNGFDTRFAPAYFEDTDYCARVWQAGLRVVYEPDVLVEHLEWGSAVGAGVPQQLIRHREVFRARHAQWLARQPRPSALPLDGDRWRSPEDRPRRPRVLVLDNEVPHMHKGGGLPRAREMLWALRDWPVTLLPLWTLEDTWPGVYACVPRTVEVALGVGFAGLEDFLAHRQGVYDVLLVSRPPNLQAIAPLRARRPELFAGMRLVYDAEALFALRDIAMASVQGRPMRLREARSHVAGEVALAQGASEVIVVCERDARHFRAAGFATRLLSHPIAVRRDVPGPASRSGLLFVGALHPGTPNEDGLLWFLREVMPRVRELSGRAPVLTVVGVCQSGKVAALAGPGLRILGPQDALQPHYDAARVFIAPARFAGGVPIKVIEAAAHGLPVVASRVLVRQLGWHDGTDIQGARDAEAFAEGIARLLADDMLWQSRQAAAWAQCESRYDPQEFVAALRSIVGTPGPLERAITQAKW